MVSGNPAVVDAGCDDRTPAEMPYVRGGAALIEYLERDERVPVMATNVSFSPTQQYRDKRLWVHADTVAGLAAEIGVPADNPEATVRRFNELAQRDDDEDFGRGLRCLRFGHQLRAAQRRRRPRPGHPRPADPRPVRSGQHHGRRVRRDLSRRGDPTGASLLFSHRAAWHMSCA